MSPTRRTRRQRLRGVLSVAALGVFALAFIVAEPALLPPAAAEPVMVDQPDVAPENTDVAEANTVVTDGNSELTGEFAELQAAVVEAEDERLGELLNTAAVTRGIDEAALTPYRLGAGRGYTLVLTPRLAPYTVDDLLALAPQTFVLLPDGSYLLSEHVVVLPGASLHLGAPGGLSLRLASGHDGFATIVSLGGDLALDGMDGSEVSITSWDVVAGAPDDTRADGRAYIRAIGGTFAAQDAHLSNLGFWSGRTGGLALTGTDRPDTGTIEPVGAVPPAVGPVTATTPGDTAPASVVARLDGVVVDHSAFGLFVSNVSGFQISRSEFTDNELGGVVLHRRVSNGTITHTTSSRNNGDGFSLARAATDIAISGSTAGGNSENGFSIDGRALADGPSAVGESLRSYGNNSVEDSTASQNGAHGIEVLGGLKVRLRGNIVAGDEIGIVVNGPVTEVAVEGNTVRDSNAHGIAMVDGVTASSVTGNIVDGASTGIYVRESSVAVKDNTVEGARSHGVTLVGETGGSDVSGNVLGGSGASAVDTGRATGTVTQTANDVAGWSDTSATSIGWDKLLRPMNAIWALIILVVLVTAVRSRRGRRVAEHPYAPQMALARQLAITPPEVIDLRDGKNAVMSDA